LQVFLERVAGAVQGILDVAEWLLTLLEVGYAGGAAAGHQRHVQSAAMTPAPLAEGNAANRN